MRRNEIHITKSIANVWRRTSTISVRCQDADFRDAFAVGEAVQRPTTLCVPIKSDDQLDLQALHRARTRLIANRTALIN